MSKAIIKTEKGNMTVEFFEQDAPKAVANFKKLANEGFSTAMKNDKGFAKGVNTHKGFLTYKPLAEDLNMNDKFRELKELV